MADKYDKSKNYSVVLNKAVEHEGFTLKPSADSVVLRGDTVTALDSQGVVESAELVLDPEPIPAPAEETHVQADR